MRQLLTLPHRAVIYQIHSEELNNQVIRKKWKNENVHHALSKLEFGAFMDPLGYVWPMGHLWDTHGRAVKEP